MCLSLLRVNFQTAYLISASVIVFQNYSAQLKWFYLSKLSLLMLCADYLNIAYELLHRTCKIMLTGKR